MPFGNMVEEQCTEKDNSCSYENALSYARIHSAKIDITPIIHFFHKKKNRSKEATGGKKNTNAQERKGERRIGNGIHIM